MRQCQAWVKKTGSQCKKSSMLGFNYCFWHYPKAPTIIVLIIGLILPVIFNKPLTDLLSRFRLCYYLDGTNPYIESITPDIINSSTVDKNTTIFKVLCSDKYSGLNLLTSNITVSYKDKEYSPIEGKVDKINCEITFSPLKPLKYGEYLFEVQLVDKARNKYQFKKSFVVREKGNELVAFVGYDIYNNAYESDRKVFKDFFESKKSDFSESFNFYIYELTISNKDKIAVLKDIYLTIDIPDIFFYWEQIGNLSATTANIYGSAAESFDKRTKGYIYIGQNFLNIKEIGPNGFVSFLILVGRSKLLPLPKEKIWEGIDIYGAYLSEGYGISEHRKVHLRISKEKFRSLR